MTIAESRDTRVQTLADAVRNAAEAVLDEWFAHYARIGNVSQLRKAISDYDAAMSDVDAEEEDRVAAYLSNLVENDPVTADDMCRVCSGTGESRGGGFICYRCSGLGVVS